MSAAVMRWADLIVATARRYKLAPSLLAGLIAVESGGNPDAVSAAGAVGLGQVMPGEAIGGRPMAEALHDPTTNLDWAGRILADNRERWHTQAGMLAAYYGAVDNSGHPSAAHDGSGVDGWGYVERVEGASTEYLDLDQRADADFIAYAPLSGAWREAAINLRGVSDSALTVGRAMANAMRCIATQATANATRWGDR